MSKYIIGRALSVNPCNPLSKNEVLSLLLYNKPEAEKTRRPCYKGKKLCFINRAAEEYFGTDAVIQMGLTCSIMEGELEWFGVTSDAYVRKMEEQGWRLYATKLV